MDRKKRWTLAMGVGAAFLALLGAGLDNRLTETWYTVGSGKLTAPFRFALLTDLHSCAYGPGQTELIDRIRAGEPDAVFLVGDIVDDDIPHDGALRLIEGIARDYPCYYVTGNHEFRTGEVDLIKDLFRDRGVTVLEGECVTLELNGQNLNLCGVDDPEVGEREFVRQLDAAFMAARPGLFTLLLCHRPERFVQYAAYPCDLALAGHAHGGQWRIPYVWDGVYAPHQGFNPPYTNGLYSLDGTQLLVSRGLARETTRVPRLFNRPEVVFVDLVPAQ